MVCIHATQPEFSKMKRSATSIAIVLAVSLMWGASLLAAEQPNIVWIFVEDMNGWYGCYGDDTVPTPNLDKLASVGIRFDRTYMPAGVCSATRSAIALGAMQTSLGVHNHRSSRQRVPEELIHLPDGVKTVYEVMREQGYFVTDTGGKNDFNFLFDEAELYDITEKRIGFKGPNWRKRKDGQPFFAQIQLKGGKNSGQFKGSDLSKNSNATPHTNADQMQVAPYYPDHPVMRREYAHHYDCVRQTDDEVGEIIDALAADDLLDDTVIFFWTDHGMRLPRHKQWLYEGGIRVPLIVAGPGISQNTSRDDLVSGIDITVATLGLAGIEKPAWMEGRDFFTDDYVPRDFVISARDRCDFTIERVRAVTTKRYKYLRNFLTDRPFMQPQYRDGRDYVEVPRELFKAGKLNEVQAFMWSKARVSEELYDLKADPHEIHNLAKDAAHAKTLQRHRAILASWIKETGDQGQVPESIDSLRGVLERWDHEAVNPEYKAARAAAAALPPNPPKGFQAIFNGKNLDGWEGSDKYWSVEEGRLTGVADGSLKMNRFLTWKGGTVKNFDLRVKVKVTAGGNSGIQYRGQERPDLGDWVVTGYQADVVPGRLEYNGMLYEERGRRILAHTGERVIIDVAGQPWVVGKLPTKKFPADQWHDYHIRVEGNHHQHWIDGRKTVDVIDLDEKGRALEGVIAVQVHVGPAMKIQYRNFYLRHLKDDLPLITADQAPIPKRAVKVVPQGG
jgi:N-sulfoglucosamine sulfohydrolase